MALQLEDLPNSLKRYLSTPVADRAAVVDDVFSAEARVHDEGRT